MTVDHVILMKNTEKPTIQTNSGKFEYVRVDEDFLCPCGCLGRVRRKHKYSSPSCRFRMQKILLKTGSKTLATKLAKKLTQPTENSTLLIQTLLTSPKKENSPK